jgi:hypothetical protein
MNNHKLVTISILYDKMRFYFLENIHENLQNLIVCTKTKHIFCVFEMRNSFELVLEFFEIPKKKRVFLISGPYLTV